MLALERMRLKISLSKTEYQSVNEEDSSAVVAGSRGEEGEGHKYFESTVQQRVWERGDKV